MKKTLITTLSLVNLTGINMEDDFYATIKLLSGEEIFAKVAATEEDDRTLLLVSNPVVVNEIKSRMGCCWLQGRTMVKDNYRRYVHS